jgi:hypothetical protein
MVAFAFFQDENVEEGLPAAGSFQAGNSNLDTGSLVDQGFTLPWMLDDPTSTWLDYRCYVEIFLDSGLALHKPLPQGFDQTITVSNVDSLASVDVDDSDTMADETVLGTTTASLGGYTDYLQRMATSTYRFVLRGWGVRAGFKVPIPGLVSVAGVPAYPAETQHVVDNVVVGNLSGIPVYSAAWELWYYVSIPPTAPQTPPANLALHIRGDAQPPANELPIPVSQSDQSALPQGPNP